MRDLNYSRRGMHQYLYATDAGINVSELCFDRWLIDQDLQHACYKAMFILQLHAMKD